ncbi:hypothetical protein ACFL0V_00255 [Nanoarchaeota archaeon]
MVKNLVPKAEVLFEVSWEVCNKVGGIHTVLKSKVGQMLSLYKEYYLIGPYFPDAAKGHFVELPHPQNCRTACKELSDIGIVVHYGESLIGQRPKTLLIDFQPFFAQTNNIKKILWEEFKIDSLNSKFDFEEPVVWGWVVGIVLEKLAPLFKKKVVAQFHEWLCGSAILYLKRQNVDIGLTFTTHATVLGRALANKGFDLYSKRGDHLALKDISPDQEAYTQKIQSKHQLEKASAQNADIFATVSEVTAMEAEHFLSKKPDILMPNGINIDDFPSREECSVQHAHLRDKIFRFLAYYFYPYYEINFNHTHLFFIASRYEFHDKGIDVFINALGKLNENLKKAKSKETVVAFFWVPSGIRGIKPELIENRTFFEDIEQSIEDKKERIMRRILTSVLSEKKDLPLLPESINKDMFPKVLRFKREDNIPPVCTHDIMAAHDNILHAFHENNLKNLESDKVKVIFYPVYLTGADGLLNLDYYEAMQGSHFGVFPSHYEPYGYTPLECASFCVTSLTSDVAGFGRYISQKNHKNEGIYVLKRQNRSPEEITDDLAKTMFNYLKIPKNKRIELKFEARSLAEQCDWKMLVNNYIDAHNRSIKG